MTTPQSPRRRTTAQRRPGTPGASSADQGGGDVAEVTSLFTTDTSSAPAGCESPSPSGGDVSFSGGDACA